MADPSHRPWQAQPRAFARIVARLTDGITDDVIAAVHSDMPPTANAGGAFDANLRAGIDAAYDQLYQEIGVPLDEPDRSVYRAFGRAQARAGRSFDEMQAFYRISALVFWRRISAAARMGALSVATVAVLGEVIIAYIHELSIAAASGFTEEQAARERAADQRRQTLVRVLIQRPAAARETVLSAAKEAEWSLPARVAVIVGSLEGAAAAISDRSPSIVSATVDGRHCVVLSEEQFEGGTPLADIVPRTGTAAIGPMVRWQDAAHSFRQADAVFDLAARGLIQRQPLIRAQDHAANLAIVGQPELMRELVASRLAPLTPLPAATRQRLSETLEAWVAQPDRPQVIADRLQIHVQTVRYRMRQLRQLFGDSLQDPHARFELAMALRAERLGVVP